MRNLALLSSLALAVAAIGAAESPRSIAASAPERKLAPGETFVVTCDAWTPRTPPRWDGDVSPASDRNDGADGDSVYFRRHNISRAWAEPAPGYWYTSAFRHEGEPDPAGEQFVEYRPPFERLGRGVYAIEVAYRNTLNRAAYPARYEVHAEDGVHVVECSQKLGKPSAINWVHLGTFALGPKSFVRGIDPGPASLAFGEARLTFLGERGVTPGFTSAVEVEAGTRWETVLAGSAGTKNPYHDTQLRVQFVAENGEKFHATGFWDGGRIFRVRTAFPNAGRWTWTTTSNDPELDARIGSVRVVPARSSGGLAAKGFLRVAESRSHLCFADGTPFFWLGDAAWHAPSEANRADWLAYLDDRAQRGFTVVQLYFSNQSHTKNALGEPLFLSSNFSQWNPAWFRNLDQMINDANDRGLVVLLTGLMAPVKWNTIRDLAHVADFVRNCVGRYHANHVVFSPAADSKQEEDVEAIAAFAAREIRAATDRHLITQHWSTRIHPVIETMHAPELDLLALQTGHNFGDLDKTFAQAADWPLLIRRGARKPVINIEAMYAHGGGRGVGTAYQARAAGYLSVLSGSAGYGFGHVEVFDWVDIRNAMRHPSTHDMTVLGRVFASLPWWRLEPAPELIVKQPVAATKRMACARDMKGDFIVAYLPDNPWVDLKLDDATQQRLDRASWVDPVSGRAGEATGQRLADGTLRFVPPHGVDSLLVLWSSAQPWSAPVLDPRIGLSENSGRVPAGAQ